MSLSAPFARGATAIAASVLAAVACATTPPPESVTPPIGQLSVYRCADDFTFSAIARNDTLHVSLPGRMLTLPLQSSDSGMRYSGDGYTVTNQGTQAVVETPSQSYQACQIHAAGTPWETARILGYQFRAVGQEPAWSAEVSRNRGISVTIDEGRTNLMLPDPTMSEAEGAITYTARNAVHEVTMLIEPGSCMDTMSGESFPNRVVVTVDGQPYRGCGRPLISEDAVAGASPLRGTYWKLASLGGQTPIASSERTAAHLQFMQDEPRVAGSAGCNRLTGGFSADAATLRFSAPGLTRMACVEAGVMEQEQRFVDVLTRTTNYRIQGMRLTLFAGDTPLADFVAAPEPQQ